MRLRQGVETEPTSRQLLLWRLCLWGLPLLAVSLVALYALRLGGGFLIVDEGSYLEYADSWARLGDFVVMRYGSLERSVFWPPLWPILLAYVGQVLPGVTGARLFNAALLALTLHLVARTCRERGDISPAPLAFAMGLYLPIAVYTAVLLLPQTLCATLLALSLWVLGRRERIAGWSIWIGLLAAAMALANLTLVPALLCGLLFLVLRGEIRFRHLVVATLLPVLAAGAWTARNYHEHGHLVFTTNSGLNLALGNAPTTRVDSGSAVDLSAALPPGSGVVDEFELNRLNTRYALANLRQDPWHYVGLYFGKLMYWFMPTNKLRTEGLTSWWKEALAFVTYYGLLGLTMVAFLRGGALARRDSLYLVGVYLGAALFYALFFTRVRFRVPVDALLIPLAALGLQWVLARVRRPWRAAAEAQ